MLLLQVGVLNLTMSVNLRKNVAAPGPVGAVSQLHRNLGRNREYAKTPLQSGRDEMFIAAVSSKGLSSVRAVCLYLQLLRCCQKSTKLTPMVRS